MNKVQKKKIVSEGNIVEEVSNLSCLGRLI